MMAAIQMQPAFCAGLKGQLLVDEPMSKHTSWRVGGKADYFYTPADKADLLNLLQQLPSEMPIYWVGLGSNLLVRDGGVKGIVIRTTKGLNEISVNKETNRLYVEAGVSCAKVARTCVNHGLTGVEFLAGVPGSFGGALAMNAGAFGGETWPWVEDVECVDGKGQRKTIIAGEVNYGYRRVDLPENYWFLGGTLKLSPAGDESAGKQQIKSLLEKRSASQPIQSANAGSVFRNPEGGFAARLIEQCGLKGKRSGNARISEVHANFIINEGNAKAQDIESLITLAQTTVKEQFGIELEPEVRMIGRAQ